jgi:hypothetical protein
VLEVSAITVREQSPKYGGGKLPVRTNARSTRGLDCCQDDFVELAHTIGDVFGEHGDGDFSDALEGGLGQRIENVPRIGLFQGDNAQANAA